MYSKLRPFIQQIGTDTFKTVYNMFDCLHSYEIDNLQEILEMDLTLIHRKKK